MWIFTSKGFFSLCQNKDDPDLIHVRAQFKGDLEELLAGVWHSDITETPGGDYRYRCDVRRDVLGDVIRSEIADPSGIDYTRFKAAVDYTHDVDGGEIRKEAYLSVFNRMMQAGLDEATTLNTRR